MTTPASLGMKGSSQFYNFLKDQLRDTWVYSGLEKVRQVKQHLMRRSSGERFLLQQYFEKTGKHLNVTRPETFSEKLYCRMISLNRDKHPRITQYADKYAVRAYVAGKIGDEHLVKLLWHGEDPQAIPFDSLPTEY